MKQENNNESNLFPPHIVIFYKHDITFNSIIIYYNFSNLQYNYYPIKLLVFTKKIQSHTFNSNQNLINKDKM